VAEVGRKATPGRPVLYGTTDQFLHQFNLNDLSQLPPVEFDDSKALAIVSTTLSSEAISDRV
jgi:chromosome segregation and condensation protein ScpB